MKLNEAEARSNQKNTKFCSKVFLKALLCFLLLEVRILITIGFDTKCTVDPVSLSLKSTIRRHVTMTSPSAEETIDNRVPITMRDLRPIISSTPCEHD